MTTSAPDAGTDAGPGRRWSVGTGKARAYCGPAHGRQWTVDQAAPPPVVELDCDSALCRYRLVLQRRSGRPARDDLGNYLYVPFAAPVGRRHEP